MFNRPEINQVYDPQEQHVEMYMYVLSNEHVPSPDGRFVVLRVQGQEPPAPTLPAWLVDMASGQIQRLTVKGQEVATPI